MDCPTSRNLLSDLFDFEVFSTGIGRQFSKVYRQFVILEYVIYKTMLFSKQ